MGRWGVEIPIFRHENTIAMASGVPRTRRMPPVPAETRVVQTFPRPHRTPPGQLIAGSGVRLRLSVNLPAALTARATTFSMDFSALSIPPHKTSRTR